MSWSIYPDIRAVPASEARAALEKQNIPQPIKDYLNAGIDGLVEYYKDEDVLVSVTGAGHLCEGAGSSPDTSATCDVRKG